MERKIQVKDLFTVEEDKDNWNLIPTNLFYQYFGSSINFLQVEFDTTKKILIIKNEMQFQI